MSKKLQSVKIYIDGSCPLQGTDEATAGYGVAVRGAICDDILGKLDGIQDSSRAEVTALLKALNWLSNYPGLEATIYTDSRMVADVVHGLLDKEDADQEERKYWKLTKDLWNEIFKVSPLIEGRLKNVCWIGRDENNEANKLARRAANALILVSNQDLPRYAS